ncbi:hypothetical protein TL13_1311 [Streptococcus suis TL13]|nr:hypothetical protein TL13_1311 [Streptococcus suis TL13]
MSSAGKKTAPHKVLFSGLLNYHTKKRDTPPPYPLNHQQGTPAKLTTY